MDSKGDERKQPSNGCHVQWVGLAPRTGLLVIEHRNPGTDQEHHPSHDCQADQRQGKLKERKKKGFANFVVELL